MDIVRSIHSAVRFVVLIAAVVGILKTLLNLVQARQTEKVDQTIASAFVGLYDLQVLLGILIILLGGLTQAIHPIVMAVGVISAHGFQSVVRRNPGSRENLLRLALFVVPLVIILIGLATINHLPV